MLARKWFRSCTYNVKANVKTRERSGRSAKPSWAEHQWHQGTSVGTCRLSRNSPMLTFVGLESLENNGWNGRWLSVVCLGLRKTSKGQEQCHNPAE